MVTSGNGRPRFPHLIGIGGARGAGKDAVADVLERTFGFERASLDDPAREALERIDPLVTVRSEMLNKSGEKMLYMRRLREILEDYERAGRSSREAWNEAKGNPEVAGLLRRAWSWGVGVHPMLWTELTLSAVGEPQRLAITDVRQPAETQFVRERGGKTIRVTRPGHQVFDTPGMDWDWTLENDSTLEHLAEKIGRVLEALRT